MRDLGRLDLQETEVEIFTTLIASYREYGTLQETYFASIRDGAPNQEVGNAALSALNTTVIELDRLITVNDEFAALSYDTAVSTYQSSLRNLMIGLGLSIGLGLLLAYIVSRSITRPINRLVAASRRIGEGDLSQLLTLNSRDELSVLALSFNQTVLKLRQQVESNRLEREQSAQLQQNVSAFLDVAMDIAEGDFTKRGNVTEDVLG